MTVRMGMKLSAAAGAVALLVGAGATGALAQAAASAPMAAPAPAAPALPRPEPYLGKARLPNSIAILPPPPAKDSTEDRLDNEVYRSTRALAGTPRGALAIKDVTGYVPAFDCALGIRLEDGGVPQVQRLFSKVARDASDLTNMAKDHYGHPRPFLTNHGSMCSETDREGLTKSMSYPSGHTTYSWAMGLILAELAPEHATAILARARAFGESRVVCGVHTVSDIEAGRTNGAVLVAALHGDPAFRADLDTARAALAAALAAPHAAPDAGQCKVDAYASAHTPWINPDTDK